MCSSLSVLSLRTMEGFSWRLNVHDEFQVECEERHAELIGQTIKQSIIAAGEHFKLHCPLDGSYDIGGNWADTH